MKDKKKIIRVIIFCLLLIICLYYLYSKGTYTSYESTVSTNADISVAKWDVRVNNTVITSGEDANIDISNIDWYTEHVIDGKAAPGSKGIAEIIIDPGNTGVAFEYEFSIIDRTKDANCLLTVNSVDSDDVNFSRIDDITYSGFFSVDDIKSGKVKTISLDVEWINDDKINDFDYIDSVNGSFLILDISVSQYKG